MNFLCAQVSAVSVLLNEMNKCTSILNAFEYRLRAGLVQHTMQTNP